LRALRATGLEVLHASFLPPSQLRVGCSDGLSLTIEGDPFLVYAFDTSAEAAGYAAEARCARAAGRFVFRSTPFDMYVFPGEVLYAGDEHIRWPTLVSDSRFVRALDGLASAGERVSSHELSNGGAW
jgi:hypothetical protein